MRLSLAAPLALALTVGLAACTDPEVEPYDDGEERIAVPETDPGAAGPPVVAFLNACRETLAETPAESDDALESCECAVAAARDRFGEFEYQVFLDSFRPDRAEATETLLTREGIDLERFNQDLTAIQEECGFSRPVFN